MNESSLGVHEVEFVVQALPSLPDGRRVGQAADRALDPRQVAVWHHGRRLVVDSNLHVTSHDDT